jgi:pimeloyl-ACP methyl ester carboxylesterase
MPELTMPDGLTVRFDDRGSGRPFLLLHGGGGPLSVLGFAQSLAELDDIRVITPTIPGFDGTARPAEHDSIAAIARTYGHLLDALDLHDLVVVGSSVGGWIAAQLALDAPDRLSGVVLINAVGIAVDGHPITDISGLTIDKIADFSYYEPDRFRVDPAKLPQERLAAMAANGAVFATYQGNPYGHDPALRARLGSVQLPVAVVWGVADGIVDVDYGRAYAASFGSADFVLVEKAGHLPFMEQPEVTRDIVTTFASKVWAG